MRISRNPQQVIQQPRSCCEKVLGAASKMLIGENFNNLVNRSNLMLAVGALFLSFRAFYTVSRYATVSTQYAEQEFQASNQISSDSIQDL